MKSHKLFSFLLILVFVMFIFGFALVPLYNVLCKQLGINGKTDSYSHLKAKNIDLSRLVTIEFFTSNNANLPWTFYPHIKKIHLHPGENILINFSAKNNSAHSMTIQAIPSVSPGIAANYLKKTECFCFARQYFQAGEEKVMPVLFHIDPKLPGSIKVISLSYTLFDTAHITHPLQRRIGALN